MSARAGGVSLPPYDACNLGDHVQDDPRAVARNRALFAQLLGATPMWLTQVHGNRIVRLSRDAADGRSQADGSGDGPEDGPEDGRAAPLQVNPEIAQAQPRADGALTTERGLACTVMVADCLPLLLAAPQARGVAALHAGWRGLAGAGEMRGQGVVHTGVRALCEATGADPADLQVWLGPCIGPTRFEVGPEVLAGFGVDPSDAIGHPRFQACGNNAQPKWLADLSGLACDTLHALGVRHIAGGQWCTVSDASRFFSFRRDGVTGRQAAAICLV